MGKFIDLTGQTFGRLTVIGIDHRDDGIWWVCECSCSKHNKIIVSTGHLKNGGMLSCGCYRIEKMSVIGKNSGHKKLKDYTGKIFGKLTVVERVEDYISPKGKHQTQWLCKCDCGNTAIVSQSHLKTGKTKSCGCLNFRPYGEAMFNRLLDRYKRNAKSRNLSFELTKEEFRKLTKSNCFYCGEEPSAIISDGRSNGEYIYNGVDRLNSSIGYTIINSVGCCWTCNRIKNDIPKEEFISWIERVYNNLKNKKDGKE